MHCGAQKQQECSKGKRQKETWLYAQMLGYNQQRGNMLQSLTVISTLKLLCYTYLQSDKLPGVVVQSDHPQVGLVHIS